MCLCYQARTHWLTRNEGNIIAPPFDERKGFIVHRLAGSKEARLSNLFPDLQFSQTFYELGRKLVCRSISKAEFFIGGLGIWPFMLIYGKGHGSSPNNGPFTSERIFSSAHALAVWLVVFVLFSCENQLSILLSTEQNRVKSTSPACSYITYVKHLDLNNTFSINSNKYTLQIVYSSVNSKRKQVGGDGEKDLEAWHAVVHALTKNQTRLSD